MLKFQEILSIYKIEFWFELTTAIIILEFVDPLFLSKIYIDVQVRGEGLKIQMSDRRFEQRFQIVFIDWKNIAYWEEFEQSEACVAHSKERRVQGSGSIATPGKPCHFYPHLSLEMVFPVVKLSQKYYIMNIGSPAHHIFPA